MRYQGRLAFAAAAAVIAALLVPGPVASAGGRATAAGTQLDLTGAGRLLVEPVTGDLFASGGEHVDVLDAEGNLLKSFGGFSHASGMATANGKVYVAQSDETALGVIDPADLDQPVEFVDVGETLVHSPNTETSIAFAGGRIWFKGNSCANGVLRSLDVATNDLVSHSAAAPLGCPMLLSTPAAPNLLAVVATKDEASSESVRMVDVSADAPVQKWQAQPLRHQSIDGAFSPDASQLLLTDENFVQPLFVSNGREAFHDSFRSPVEGLAVTSPGAPKQADAVVLQPPAGNPDVWLDRLPGGSLLSTLSFPDYVDPVRHGVAFTPDGSRLYVMTYRVPEPHYAVQVVDTPLKPGSFITASVRPETQLPGGDVTFSGELTTAIGPVGGLQLSVTRSLGTAVQETRTLTIGSRGQFSWHDAIPEQAGTYTYAVSWSGDDDRRGTVASEVLLAVRGEATLSMAAADTHPEIGDTARLRGVLRSKGGPAIGDASIHISEQAPGATGFHPVGTVTTGPNGTFAFSRVVPAPGTYRWSASFAGSRIYLPTSTGAPAHLAVSKRHTTLEVTVTPSTVTYGGGVDIHAHLGSFADTANHAIALAVRSPGGTRHQLASGTLDPSGSFNFHWATPQQNSTIYARWTGDDQYALTETSRSVRVRAIVGGQMIAADGRNGIYAVYRYDSNCPTHGTNCAEYQIHVTPAHSDGNLDVAVDIFDQGAWHRLGSDRFHELGSDSTIVIIFPFNQNAIGLSFRTQASFEDFDHATGVAPWAYFQITGSTGVGGPSTGRLPSMPKLVASPSGS